MFLASHCKAYNQKIPQCISKQRLLIILITTAAFVIGGVIIVIFVFLILNGFAGAILNFLAVLNINHTTIIHQYVIILLHGNFSFLNLLRGFCCLLLFVWFCSVGLGSASILLLSVVRVFLVVEVKIIVIIFVSIVVIDGTDPTVIHHHSVIRCFHC